MANSDVPQHPAAVPSTPVPGSATQSAPPGAASPGPNNGGVGVVPLPTVEQVPTPGGGSRTSSAPYIQPPSPRRG
jgi:hypothetical protein